MWAERCGCQCIWHAARTAVKQLHLLTAARRHPAPCRPQPGFPHPPRSRPRPPYKHEVAAAHAAGHGVGHTLAQRSGNGGIHSAAAGMQHCSACARAGGGQGERQQVSGTAAQSS